MSKQLTDEDLKIIAAIIRRAQERRAAAALSPDKRNGPTAVAMVEPPASASPNPTLATPDEESRPQSWHA